MNRVAEIKPYLFLGGAPGRTEDFLRSNGITLVVNGTPLLSSFFFCSLLIPYVPVILLLLFQVFSEHKVYQLTKVQGVGKSLFS